LLLSTVKELPAEDLGATVDGAAVGDKEAIVEGTKVDVGAAVGTW
jgi:hypothetical protein